jgi:dinuclear metal center YbgI/SA1388 family protein
MSATIREVVQHLEALAPPAWAVPGDRIGLQVGDPAQEVDTIWLGLEIDPHLLAQVSLTPGQLLVVHHPFIYHPLEQVRTDRWTGAALAHLLSGHFGVYVAHTNLDASPTVGPAAVLAERLGLRELRPLLPQEEYSLRKLVVFTPPEHVDTLREALATAGAGAVGDYRECSFAVRGEGHFVAGAEARPAVGEPGAETRVEEMRLEMVFPEWRRRAVVEAVETAHPYEEPAWEVYPLASRTTEVGLGLVGGLPERVSAEEWLERVGAAVDTDRLHHEGSGEVERVALLPGSGSRAVEAARHEGADVLLTGELDYHQRQEAVWEGLQVTTAGHAETERVMLPAVAEELREHWGNRLEIRCVSEE